MKPLILAVVSACVIFMASACSKNNVKGKPFSFTGKWSLVEIFANDYWGGPAYWQVSKSLKKMVFTADNKYFIKLPTDSDYIFIGTYKKLSDNKIQITQANPINPASPVYVLYYTFSKGGYMTWGNFATEGVIKEKYELDN